MKTKFVSIVLLFIGFVQGLAQPLQLSDNKRYLEKASGQPFFWLADTGWEMFHRLSRKEIDHYMSSRQEQGFNVIQCVILSEINGVTVPNAEGHLPLVELDATQPNESYFKLVDYAVRKAADMGIYLAMLPTWGSYVDGDPHPLFDSHKIFDPENAKDYGRFLGNRYRDDWNVIWILGGDRPAAGHEDIWQAMAEGLASGDARSHLISYHPRGQQSSSFWFHNASWLDFNMVQTGHLQPGYPVYDWITHDYELTPVKPVINGEPAYEDIGYWFNPLNGRYDDYNVRKNAWWSVFAGAFGHTYGNNNIWQMYDEGRNPIIWARIPWHEALLQPGASQLIHLKNLVLSRPYLTKFPDQRLLTSRAEDEINLTMFTNDEGPDLNPSYSTDHIRVMRDGTPGKKDATYIMAYLPFYRNFALETSVIPDEELHIWWYNPRTGEALDMGIIKNQLRYYGSNWSDRIEQDMGGPDWVVVIDGVSHAYPTPGTTD